MENLHDRRKVYTKYTLDEDAAAADPMVQFRQWYQDAERASANGEANAMSLSTVEEDGCPRTRIVLLKEYGPEGFVFFTNYQSRKGHSIELMPKVCLHFFWPVQERQVIIKADAERLPPAQSDAYFQSRPRGSQIGSAASPQSSVVAGRQVLEQLAAEVAMRYEGQEVPRPQHWGGYLARPYEVEFWQGRPDRLHDRLLYCQVIPGGAWEITRLAP